MKDHLPGGPSIFIDFIYINNNVLSIKNELINLYNKVFFEIDNKLRISLQKELNELKIKRDKLINLNILNIIFGEGKWDFLKGIKLNKYFKYLI